MVHSRRGTYDYVMIHLYVNTGLATVVHVITSVAFVYTLAGLVQLTKAHICAAAVANMILRFILFRW